MAFWDEFKDKVSDVSTTIVDRTRNLARVAQINGTLSDMKKERERNYAQLGRLFYEDRYGRMKIKTVEKKIAELEDGDIKKEIALKVLELKQSEKIEEELIQEKRLIKEAVRCPECGAEVTPDSKFCITCGSKLVWDEEEAEESSEENEELTDEADGCEDEKTGQE